MIITQSFTSKKLPTGEKIYRRKHGYLLMLAASDTTVYTVTCPYSRTKINQAEIVWAPEGVTLSMKVKDSTTGTYSGIANAVLNQFGFDVVVGKDFYSDYSQYDADIYANMQIEFTFTNNSVVEKQIGLNVIFHEIV